MKKLFLVLFIGSASLLVAVNLFKDKNPIYLILMGIGAVSILIFTIGIQYFVSKDDKKYFNGGVR